MIIIYINKKMDNATKYELVSKVDGSVVEVTGMSFGEEIVTASTGNGDIIFTNKDKAGDLQNDEYAIREVGTYAQADGTGTVNDLGIDTE